VRALEIGVLDLRLARSTSEVRNATDRIRSQKQVAQSYIAPLIDNVRTEEDRDRLRANGLDGPDRLPHPCRHYSTPACTIYAVRPAQCCAYRCEVLKAFLDGDMQEHAAHALIDRALSMRAGVSQLLPEGTTFTGFAEDMKTGAPASRSSARLPALARFLAYRLFVERHFLSPDSHWLPREEA
jgi:hypothetical protein